MKLHTAGLATVLEATEGFEDAETSSGNDDLSCFSGFATAFFEAAVGAALEVGAPPPVLHLTVAFSKASVILAFLISATLSMIAFNGLSPTIFMR